MKTKEIGGVLYELVPEEEEESCKGCAFKDSDGASCIIFSKDCNEGLIYKKVDEPISTSNLKPFNLEEAKAGKPVCTRDGRKARIICFDRRDTDNHCIVALIEDKELPNKESIRSYYDNGKYLSSDEESVHDLMMLPEKKEGWIIKPKDYQVYQNKEDAERVCNEDYQVIAKISWEE